MRCPVHSLPHFRKRRGTATSQFLTARNDILQFLAKLVDCGIRILPGIHQSLGVERPHHPTDILQFEQPRTGGDEQSDRQLDRRDCFHQVQPVQLLKQIQSLLKRGPRREWNEGWLQRDTTAPA